MTDATEDTTTDLRSRILEALNTAPAAFVQAEPDGTDRRRDRPWWRHDEHRTDGECALCRGEAETLTDAVLAAIGDQAVEHVADQFMSNARLRSMEIRNGSLDMDLTEAQELAAMYVGMARAMLGDAENYTETPIGFPKGKFEFTVKVAEEFEWYVLTVQRKGKLTPHEARRRAEAERDELRELLARGVDDDPCEIDHNGLCQTHWLSPAPCRNAEGRRLLGLEAQGDAQR